MDTQDGGDLSLTAPHVIRNTGREGDVLTAWKDRKKSIKKINHLLIIMYTYMHTLTLNVGE